MEALTSAFDYSNRLCMPPPCLGIGSKPETLERKEVER
jgi:hypothetical protein